VPFFFLLGFFYASIFLIVSVLFLASYREKNVSFMKLIASVFYIRYLLYNYVLNIDYVKAKIIYFVKFTAMSNI